ncbi:putative WD40 domain-containing protein [Encephalitozoon intestinalis ATCC 50506]|uniref:WD40 domain-containing protein n=1 Tax=Encephalitozoon intestinalis (strain ATCC 50506) TaxID=876142 RepID=E0S740_ENCIT|nr:putative WD40 domain-containing protein [Encephalitozoon intestinalis ATCC 50506]ADM11468.1 putative WD40 domain-containing protein [Encephalitozoon intestinalis ATCC 50506]UTX45180.1 WD40 domain-containing protein [Encephalitozoon intestinalis]
MKVHFNLKKQMKPILTTGVPKRQGDILYTQFNDLIVETDVKTFQILREIPFDSLKCFDVRDGYIVACSKGIVIYNLAKGVVEDVVQFSKIEVCSMVVDELVVSDEGFSAFSVVVGRVDGSVSKIDLVSKAPLWSYRMDSMIRKLERFGNMVCSADANEVWIYKGGEELLKYHEPEVVGIGYNGRHVCAVTREGVLKILEKSKKVALDTKCDFMVGDGQFLYIWKGLIVHVYDYDGKIQYKRDILAEREGSSQSMLRFRKEDGSFEDESEENGFPNGKERCEIYGENSDDCYEDESGTDDGYKKRKHVSDMRNTVVEEEIKVDDEVIVEGMSQGVIVTSEQEIFLVDESLRVTSVIIGNNDEITDMKKWNDVLFVATNSGRLRYTFVDGGEGSYAFNGDIVPAHSEAIMSLSINGNFLMTTSRDKKAILWKIVLKDTENREEKSVVLKRIKTLENGLGGLNGCVLGASIFVLVGSDQILQIWDYKDNVFMERIHDKEINSVEINEERRLIATCSQDKKAKVFNFEGRILQVLSGHTKGVWSVSFGKNLMATCSADTTVRIWDIETFECVGVLTAHRSAVLKGQFYRNDERFISGCATGEMKVWNVKKRTCEMNIDVHRDRVWAFISGSLLITSGNGLIAFFQDDSQEVLNRTIAKKNEKEMQTIELERCLRNNLNVKAVEILSRTDDYKQLFRMIVRCHRERSNEIFTIFEDKHKMFFDLILKQGTFKNCVVIQWLIEESLRRGWKMSSEVLDKVYKVTEKYSDSIDGIYSTLLGFTIFER